SNDFTPLSAPPPEVSWQAGTLFEFRIRGEDHAGNREDWPATPDAVTRIESHPPHTSFIDPPAYARTGGLLYYQAADVGGSQVANYDVQRFNNDTQTWEMLASETTSTEIGVGGLPGTSWTVRVRARDTAGNEEPWPQAGDPGYHTVGVYTAAIYGTAHAATGNPVSGVEVAVADGTLLAQENSDPGGAYASFVIYDTVIQAAFSKPGYGGLPWSTYAGFLDYKLDLYLPPADNLVQDSDLVLGLASPASPWAVGGTLPITPAASQEPCHTGSCAALGSTSLIFTPFETVFPAALQTVDLRTYAASDNSLHLIAHMGTDLYYRQRTAAGTWLPYETIHTAAANFILAAEVKTDASGVAHLIYLHNGQVFYIQRSLAGAWSSPRRISGEANANSDWSISDLLQVDAQGGVHAMWQCNWDGLYSDVCYARRTPAGSWSAPEVVESVQGAHMQIRFRLTSSGIVHAAWSRESSSPPAILYARRSVDGTWSSPVELGQFSDYAELRFTFELDASQRPMVAWVVYGGFQNFLIRQRWQQANGSWSALQERDLGIYYTYYPYAKLAYDSQARLHMLFGNDFHYFILPRSGELERRGVIVPDLFEVNDFSLAPDGKIHLVYRLNNRVGAVYSLLEGGEIRETLFFTDFFAPTDAPWMFVDASQTPHFLYHRDEILGGEQVYVWDHTTRARAASAETGELSQTVTIPGGMNQAGLSLLYLLKGGQAAGSTGLSAWIEAGDGTQEMWHTHTGSIDWQHAWVDVSDYAGETVRVILRMDQAAGEVRMFGYLDEVSLGTGYGDAWLGVDAQERKVRPDEPFAVEIPYGNQGGFALPGGVIEVSLPAGLELLDSSLACTGGPAVYSCAAGTLAARAEGVLSLSLRSTPGAPAFQRLEIGLRLATTGSELELLNNQGILGVRLANELFVPAIGNWWVGE
ncbi:MAG TPA: fibronectin type III domain-containing protein, partial [Anaerolineales bacterium]|nr:fibronectin type III domain-containing protein [Anaerolineales bacterium]